MESLIKVKPDLSELRVFGCGAYVFLPEEVRANKLAPRSELMTYIGYETGIKGWRFVQPSGAIFTGATATFDETLFPRCPGAKTPARTDLGETPDPEGHIPHGTPDDGVMPPGPSSEASSQDGSNDNHGKIGEARNRPLYVSNNVDNISSTTQK